MGAEKPIDWVGTSLKELKRFPAAVKQFFGFRLHEVQQGSTPHDAKPLKGKGFKGVYELRDNYEGNTYRAVYIAKFTSKIYVLHCFQKKATRGIATTKHDLDLIIQRLKIAIEDQKQEQ